MPKMNFAMPSGPMDRVLALLFPLKVPVFVAQEPGKERDDRRSIPGE
jgi:hypothetical protein